jgi:hypothetical protein
MVSEVPEQGGEVIQFRRRTPPEPIDELELSDHQPGGELATRDANAVEDVGPVVDAELLEEDSEQPGSPTKQVAILVKVVQPIIVVVRHERTVATSKVIARNLAFVVIGLGVVLKKWYDRRSGAIYHRQMLAAEAVGNQDRLEEWEQRASRHRGTPRPRRSDAAGSAGASWSGRCSKAALLGLALLLLAGILYGVASEDIRVVLDPLVGTVRAVGWLIAAAGVSDRSADMAGERP